MNKFVEDLRQRKLQIDFTELKLVQSKATNPVSYTGAGYIRQTDDDLLSFKLYSVHFANTNCVPDLKRLGRFVSGTLYDDEDYYTLTGTAVDGTTWVAEKVLPHADWPLSRTNPVLQGRIAHCVRGERSPTSRDLQMYYFEKADIPCWLNQVKFDAGGCEFHIETTEVGFSVTAKSDATIPKHFHVRVEESLRFLLARSISCRALMEHGPLQLFSSNQRSHRTLLPPPIARSGPAWHDDSWRLFKCYLDYVVRGTTQAYWNTCTNHLHNACEASANSLDAWGIGLSVAVEGVASLLPKELDPAAKEKLEALQTFIVDQVSANADHKKFAPRIKGMVNGLTQIRAIDRMKALAASGETDIAHVKAWEKLRNPGVHPTKRAELDIASIDYQKLIDKVHSVVVLMYHILFSLIGYKGGYTDYSVHGYPQRQYPVSANAAPAETAPALAAAPPVTKVKKARPRKARTTKPPASKKGAKVAAKRSKASAAPKPRRSRIKK